MNIEGIRNDLRNGWNVLVEAPSRTQARVVFESIAQIIGGDVSRIVRVAGRECITTSSGTELRVSVHAGPELRITIQ